VNDIAIMLLFVIFYRLLKENNDGLSVAELWRRAQIALYNETRESARKSMMDLVAMWDESQRDGCRTSKIVRKGR
jgi:hypothetical protein